MIMLRIAMANMHCGGCAKGVRASLSEAAPGAAVIIDLDRRQVTVAASDAGAIIAALCADGWDARPASP